MTRLLPPWSSNAVSRITKTPKRTKEQDEVDLVIEDQRGRVIGIEVKASATVRVPDLRGLRQLQAAVGDKFVQGLVLHDHDRITPFDEKLHAGPVSPLAWLALSRCRLFTGAQLQEHPT